MSGLSPAKEAQRDRLTVRESRAELENARVAYLSRLLHCREQIRRLADEVIHVVSGLRVAGFPHVIGVACGYPSIGVRRRCTRAGSLILVGGFYADLERSEGGIRHSAMLS